MCCVEVSMRERSKMKEFVMLIPFLLGFLFLSARILLFLLSRFFFLFWIFCDRKGVGMD